MHYAERELFRYTKGSVARHSELPSNAQEKAWYMFERSECAPNKCTGFHSGRHTGLPLREIKQIVQVVNIALQICNQFRYAAHNLRKNHINKKCDKSNGQDINRCN